MSEPAAYDEIGPEDEALLRELRQAAHRHDPVPPVLLSIAKDSFTWRTVDEELAEMVWDSAAPADFAHRGVLVRSSTADIRLLSFATPHLTLELEILATGSRRRLIGELSPEGPARVVVEHQGGSSEDTTDAHGRFLIADLPAGRMKLRCEPSDGSGTALVTAWLEI